MTKYKVGDILHICGTKGQSCVLEIQKPIYYLQFANGNKYTDTISSVEDEMNYKWVAAVDNRILYKGAVYMNPNGGFYLHGGETGPANERNLVLLRLDCWPELIQAKPTQAEPTTTKDETEGDALMRFWATPSGKWTGYSEDV